jgi:flagellar biosynthesis protein FlhG
VVTTPEPTSVENTYLFLKSCAVRTLKLYINYYGMPASIKEAEESLESQFSSLGYFFERVHSLNALSARLLDRALKKFAPALIMNKARTENDFVLGQSIAEAARRFLGIPITYLGAVPYDEKVQSCLKKFAPYCLEYPQSDLSRALREIAEKLEDQVSAGGGG